MIRTEIPVDVRICCDKTQPIISPNGESMDRQETEEYTASGTLKKTKEGYRLEFSEDNDIYTCINTYEDMVMLNRAGPMRTPFAFAGNKAFNCVCTMGSMPIQMRVRTKELTNTLSLDGGRLEIDYSIEIAGSLAENTKISISVSPDISIIKS